jgi:lipoprotein-releasing system ATP-binding protein
MLLAKEIKKAYKNVNVLNGVNLCLNQGEVVAIIGASGAGKSTLLHILSTLDKPNSGSIEINNVNILNLSSNELAAFRNKNVGFVFQSFNLLPEFSVLENVALPAYIGGVSKQMANKKALELLCALQIDNKFDLKPDNLSGGEQQRVAIARALVNSPQIVFADEPSGSLDSKNASILHNLFLDLRKTFGQTFVIATHNQYLADMSDRKLTMIDGVLVE